MIAGKSGTERIVNIEQREYAWLCSAVRGNIRSGDRAARAESWDRKGWITMSGNMALRLVGKEEGDKQRALEAALTQIDRAFGKGSVMKLGDKGKIVEIESIPTGSLGLDIALGIGGLPKGRVVEIFGPESSGKTTLALHVVAEVQKRGGVAAFIDAEHALDPTYAHKLGVNLDDLLVAQPDTGEQALEITDTLVRSGGVDIVVIDSVAALTPRAEIEGEMGDSLPGLQARLMSQALRKLTASISKTHTLVIFINQIRMKIGVMYGSPETTTGGNALKFYASVRLDIRRTGSVKVRDEIIGNNVRHLQDRRDHRPGGQGRGDRQVRRLVLLEQPAHRPGSRQRPRIPQGQSRHHPADRGSGPRQRHAHRGGTPPRRERPRRGLGARRPGGGASCPPGPFSRPPAMLSRGHALPERDPHRLPELFRRARPRRCALGPARAAQRSQPDVRQRRDGALQELLHGR
jgi:recombination protein RecA